MGQTLTFTCLSLCTRWLTTFCRLPSIAVWSLRLVLVDRLLVQNVVHFTDQWFYLLLRGSLTKVIYKQLHLLLYLFNSSADYCCSSTHFYIHERWRRGFIKCDWLTGVTSSSEWLVHCAEHGYTWDQRDMCFDCSMWCPYWYQLTHFQEVDSA